MTQIELISPDGLYRNPVFSHAAVIPPDATLVLIGGQNGIDADGKLVAEDAPGQTRRAIGNAETALAAAGAALTDVVSWTILLAEGADLQASYAVAAELLPRTDKPPLVTAAIVAALGVPGAQVEISAVAAVRR